MCILSSKKGRFHLHTVTSGSFAAPIIVIEFFFAFLQSPTIPPSVLFLISLYQIFITLYFRKFPWSTDTCILSDCIIHRTALDIDTSDRRTLSQRPLIYRLIPSLVKSSVPHIFFGFILWQCINLRYNVFIHGMILHPDKELTNLFQGPLSIQLQLSFARIPRI